MFDRRTFIGTAAAAALSGCGASEATRAYAGPPVTQLEVRKADRVMYVWSHNQVLRTIPIDLGFSPAGTKRFEGDGKTPEGTYYIDRRNPDSRFYMGLGISYPNRRDIAYARRHHRSPGGDIFIHGESVARMLDSRDRRPDWTLGCIAVSNPDMNALYRMVPLGTPITIRA